VVRPTGNLFLNRTWDGSFNALLRLKSGNIKSKIEPWQRTKTESAEKDPREKVLKLSRQVSLFTHKIYLSQ